MDLKRSNPLYGLKMSKKLIISMKLSAILSIFMVFTSFANSYSQVEISLSAENQTIISVLDKIESDTNLRFIFGSDLYDFQKIINVDFNKAKLKNVIELIFENKLIYDLNDNIVVLKKSPTESVNKIKESLDLETNIQQAVVQKIIQGVVSDKSGTPLPGASIIESGTENGTTTDFDGNFSLTVSEDNPVLVVSFVGFVGQTVSVDGDSSISITLMEDVAGLDEVVLTGYGSQNKRDITSSISVLDLEGVAEKANTDVGQLL